MLGCEVGQGWYFGKPMPAEKARELLAGCSGSAPPSLPNVING
jgi:EAL domain-containing protein (putative c-di-GMP-specific phosphodiesterase class I)